MTKQGNWQQMKEIKDEIATKNQTEIIKVKEDNTKMKEEIT